MKDIESLIEDLPDPEGARRFFSEFGEKYPAETKRVKKNRGLLSDLLTIASFSELLRTTLLDNPEYISWLERQRLQTDVKEKDELVESLARFALTNSSEPINIILARFRRRELIRIYLKDIRRLRTITEITEEISNLADATLEYALRVARQELDNRYGKPLELTENNRVAQAQFCVVALGKLGSKELNYSSDIDLIFLYSKNGETAGGGTRQRCTNKEYFVKLAGSVAKIVGDDSGEGAAYRVDVRLRPYGRVGALAQSIDEAANYYHSKADLWEKQVLIRSRAAAGDAGIFQTFFDDVVSSVYSRNTTPEDALVSVKRSKDKIDLEKKAKSGFDVKLGKGGIREIEFIAQALQLAFGCNDKWLRAPHTLISLSRLSDRKFISEKELTDLFAAYDFLRRLEHFVQMDQGLQTHLIPHDLKRRRVISMRAGFNNVKEFDHRLLQASANVHKVFKRIFGEEYEGLSSSIPTGPIADGRPIESSPKQKQIDAILYSVKKAEIPIELSKDRIEIISRIAKTSAPFSELLKSRPRLINDLPDLSKPAAVREYANILVNEINRLPHHSDKIAALRKIWMRHYLEIAVYDIFEKLDIDEIRSRLSSLATASITAAIEIAKFALSKEFEVKIELDGFGILGLGKLGGGGMDYGSDLDLILVFDDQMSCPVKGQTSHQFYARAAEVFVMAISSMTRDGSLYRVDLRLRPDGKNGTSVVGQNTLTNYLEDRAAIWEWLAFLKLRGIGDSLAAKTEHDCRKAILNAASKIPVAKLKDETKRIRDLLEKEKSGSKPGEFTDIKFGEGGLLDIYFAVRLLQLLEPSVESKPVRSTADSLLALFKAGSISHEQFENLDRGYEFLSLLDHHLRLISGRSARLPLSNPRTLGLLARRMEKATPSQLLEELAFHRMNIRVTFEAILKV